MPGNLSWSVTVAGVSRQAMPLFYGATWCSLYCMQEEISFLEKGKPDTVTEHRTCSVFHSSSSSVVGALPVFEFSWLEMYRLMPVLPEVLPSRQWIAGLWVMRLVQRNPRPLASSQSQMTATSKKAKFFSSRKTSFCCSKSSFVKKLAALCAIHILWSLSQDFKMSVSQAFEWCNRCRCF